jgi:diaminopimelate decarboxylase
LKELTGARIKMGGVAKQFGIDEEQLGEVLAEAVSYQHVRIRGLQVYMGTQVLDAEMLISNFRTIFGIARMVKNNYSALEELDLIDFGGGFGIPYFKGETDLDLDILKTGLAEVFAENSDYFDYSQMKLLVESGRFLVAESGYFLTKVLYKKQSRGKTFLVTDGGSNFHASAAGIGRFVRHNFPITVLNKLDESLFEKVDVVGPLCTPTDLLAQDVELPAAKEGDIVCIPRSGGYGLSASMVGFLGHPEPAEVIFEGEIDYFIRKHGKREDLINRCVILRGALIKKGG